MSHKSIDNIKYLGTITPSAQIGKIIEGGRR